MSMTPSESYYSNYMVDKIYNMQLSGDKRSFETIEHEMWGQSFNDQAKEIQELRALLLEACDHIANLVLCTEPWLSESETNDIINSTDFLSRPEVKAILEKEGK